MAKQKSHLPHKAQHVKQPTTGYQQGMVPLSVGMEQAIAAYNSRDWARAEQICRLLLRARPDYVSALNLLGSITGQTSRLQEALDLFKRSVAADPNNAQANANLADALRLLKRSDEAVASYDRAISIRPDIAEAHNKRGLALKNLKRFEEAVASYDRAISIKPGYAEAYSNRGIALHELKRFEDALASYDRAISIKPDLAEAYFNRSNALKDLKRLDEAVASYDRAITLKPDFAKAYLNKSLSLLLLGDFPQGWNLYEWRWKSWELSNPKSRFAKDWDGAKVAGSLLVLPEQGLGDEIFYCGMLNDLCPYADRVTVVVDPRLVKLYQRSFSSVTVMPKNTLTANHHFDAQVYMASMGRHLRPSIRTLNNMSPCYLRACSNRVQRLRARINNRKNLICGLSWASKNTELGADKSLGLKDLKPILSLPNVDFVDLQYGDTKAEQAKLKAETGIALKHVEEIDIFNDIDGLAALISACDVVVTVSNTTAHLAAALGKPVFVMLPFSVGLRWYWHDGRDDSPWYPSAKLYRQEKIGDWNGVVDRIKEDLAALCKTHT